MSSLGEIIWVMPIKKKYKKNQITRTWLGWLAGVRKVVVHKKSRLE